MCTPQRLFILGLAVSLLGCGSDLTLPDDTAPARLQALSGDGQEGTVGSRLDDPLVVRLLDASSQPMEGVSIVFQFTNDVPDGEVNPSQAMTNSDGRASAEVRLGSTTGTHLVEARVATPAALNATFVLTALERDKKKKHGDDDDDEDDDDDD